MSNAAHYPVAMKTAAKNHEQPSEPAGKVVAFVSNGGKKKKSQGQAHQPGGPNKLKENVTASPGHNALEDQVNPISDSERKANKRGFGHVYSKMITHVGYGR